MINKDEDGKTPVSTKRSNPRTCANESSEGFHTFEVT